MIARKDSSLRETFWKAHVLIPVGAVLVVLGAVLFYLRSPWRGLPYQDSFAVGKTKEWTAYAGNWSVAEGVVKNDSNDRGAKFITGSSYWKNYSVAADVQLLGAGDAGLLIRANDAERGVDSYNGYYAGLRTTDGALVLGRAEHGWIEYPPVKMPVEVVPGKWYHLTLSAFGCSIHASANAVGANNQATVTARDPHCFPSGKVGLRSMVAGGVWRDIRVERLSREDAASFASASSPSKMAVYPTNQGTLPFSSATQPSAPAAETLRLTGPVQPIQSLRLFSTTHPARAIVRGSVILTEPLYIQDSSGGVQVDITNKPSLRVGDEVEVEGDVYPHGLIATVRNATVHPLSGLAPRAPLSVTADQAATGVYHAMLIEVEGTLYDKSPSALEVRDGQQIFRALANSASAAAAFDKLEKNSVIRLRGVCLADADHTQNTVPFALLINSPEDVKVLVGPPWWSTEHLIVLAITMLVLGFAVHLLYSRAEEWRLRAVIDERERLAHEIHDTLAQSFAGIGFQLRAIRNRVSKSSIPVDHTILLEELNRASELVRHSHDEARRSITTLRPDATEAGGLIAALEQIARQMVGRAPVTIETSVEGEVRSIPLRVLDCLFRIGQESIANAVQHGHPGKLRIRAAYSPSAITLMIQDDGSGFVFEPETQPNIDGFGLVGMRRRVESVQGMLEIETALGQGTCVVAKVPLSPNGYRFWRLAYDGEGNHVS